MKYHIIRSAMKKELAELYDMEPREFGELMKKYVHIVGEPCGRYYSTKQVALIIKLVEKPARFLSDEFIPSNKDNESESDKAA